MSTNTSTSKQVSCRRAARSTSVGARASRCTRSRGCAPGRGATTGSTWSRPPGARTRPPAPTRTTGAWPPCALQIPSPYCLQLDACSRTQYNIQCNVQVCRSFGGLAGLWAPEAAARDYTGRGGEQAGRAARQGMNVNVRRAVVRNPACKRTQLGATLIIRTIYHPCTTRASECELILGWKVSASFNS